MDVVEVAGGFLKDAVERLLGETAEGSVYFGADPDDFALGDGGGDDGFPSGDCAVTGVVVGEGAVDEGGAAAWDA